MLDEKREIKPRSGNPVIDPPRGRPAGMAAGYRNYLLNKWKTCDGKSNHLYEFPFY
jgi:hypothetical protein